MADKIILLVEDNPDDEKLTVRALQKNNIINEVAIARDGAEALDYLFCTGDQAGRDNPLPTLVLLDLKLPKVDGHNSGVNSYIRKPVDFTQFTEVVRQLGLYWLVLNETAAA
jgi:two-component system response regulator